MVNCCIACARPLLSLSFSLFPLTPFKSPWTHHSTETTHTFQIASLSRMRMPVGPRLLFPLCPLGRSHRQTDIIQVVLRSASSVIVKMGDSKIWGLQHVLCFSILGTQKNIKHKKTQILCFMFYVLCLCRFRILGLLHCPKILPHILLADNNRYALHTAHTSHNTKSFFHLGGMPWKGGKMKPFLFVFWYNNLQSIR